jgi:hypothetical protein
VAHYRVDAPLPTRFAVGEPLVPSATAVTVNGAEVTDYTIANDTIQFAAAPPDAAQVRVVYNTASDFQTHYHSAAGDAANVASFEFIATGTGQPLACALEADQIVCPIEVVASQDDVTALFETRLSSLVLPQDPIPGTLHVTPANDNQACKTTYDPATRQVAYTCPDQALPPSLDVGYEYVAGYTRTFTATGAPMDDKVWQVWIDGVQTSEFTRDGNAVTISDASLAPGSAVVIQVTP